MTIPDYRSLMLPVLKAAAHGEVRIGSVVEESSDQLQLTLEEKAELLPSRKQTVISNRVHWAKSYSGKAQLVERTRPGHLSSRRSASPCERSFRQYKGDVCVDRKRGADQKVQDVMFAIGDGANVKYFVDLPRMQIDHTHAAETRAVVAAVCPRGALQYPRHACRVCDAKPEPSTSADKL